MSATGHVSEWLALVASAVFLPILSMRISVKAKPNAKEEKVERIDVSHFIVAVKEPPRDGKANAAIAKALADYFDISASRVQLISGFSAKQKIFEIIFL